MVVEIANVSRRSATQSLLRALDILEVIARSDAGLRLVEIVRATRLPMSTAHRLLTTLEGRRFVLFDRGRRSWSIGSGCFAVGSAFARRSNLRGLALPFMSDLRTSCGMTVNLGIAVGPELVVVGQLPAASRPPSVVRPGRHLPLATTGMGRAIVRARAGQRPTYVVDDQGHAPGLICVAAPVFDEFGVAFAAVSVAGPADAEVRSAIGEVGAQVASSAHAITDAIGGYPSVASQH